MTTTTFLLIRHALCDPVGKMIAGRTPGVRLNAEGCRQAKRLAERLAGVPITAVYSSPLERALETAEPIARGHGLQVEPLPGLIELDFGAWTGRTLDELQSDEKWREFNTFRSATRMPGGETMPEVQARAVSALEELRRRHPDAVVAAVSHGDVIRGLLVHYLGAPLDFLERLEVSPASISVVRVASHGPRVVTVNSTDGAVILAG